MNTQFDSFIISYIIVGPTPSSLCQNCPGENYIFGDGCVASCPAGSYPFTYFDKGLACRTCPTKFNKMINS